MKATGIVRRIDDLGRIVIPKEIRRSLNIKDGDSLELYTEDSGCLVFRKYDYTANLQDTVIRLKEAVLENDDLKNQPSLINKIVEIERLLAIERVNVYEA